MSQALKNFPEKVLRILVVEDITIAQKIAKYMFTAMGHEVDIAESGNIALKVVEENKYYDLIFMDIGLPDIDGFTVTETIRQNSNDRINSVPIIALTAQLDDEFMQTANQIGMNDYLVKPLTQSVATDIINRCLFGEFSKVVDIAS